MKGSRGEVAEGAVSMPKNAARAVPQGINFGTVDDQHAVIDRAEVDALRYCMRGILGHADSAFSDLATRALHMLA